MVTGQRHSVSQCGGGIVDAWHAWDRRWLLMGQRWLSLATSARGYVPPQSAVAAYVVRAVT